MAVQEGKAAPTFTLEDGEGGQVSLADFAGKHVILYFYPKDDTPGCTKEACGFRDLWKEIQKAKAVGSASPPTPAHPTRSSARSTSSPFRCSPTPTAR